LPPTLGDRLAHVLTAIENIRDALSGRSVEQFSRVDANILWDIAQNDLEPLKRFVERIIRDGH
jgi:uncharacterized protein with HEPN domain